MKKTLFTKAFAQNLRFFYLFCVYLLLYLNKMFSILIQLHLKTTLYRNHYIDCILILNSDCLIRL